MTSRNFCIFHPRAWACCISNESWVIIRVTHWKWENGIWRSSEVIRGQKPQKMTNRKIFYSTLFMQGAFGTLNKDRGLLFFCFFAAYLLKYIELSKKISLWPLIDLKMTLHCPLKSQNWPQSVVGTLNKVGDLLFPLFSSLSTELHIFKKKLHLTSKWPQNGLLSSNIDLWVCLALWIEVEAYFFFVWQLIQWTT